MKIPLADEVLIGPDGFATYRDNRGLVVEQQIVEFKPPPASPGPVVTENALKEYVLISAFGRTLETKFMSQADADEQNRLLRCKFLHNLWVPVEEEE